MAIVKVINTEDELSLEGRKWHPAGANVNNVCIITPVVNLIITEEELSLEGREGRELQAW